MPRNTPTFTLVGTMSYEKGMFAFFDGNQSNLRKVLYQSDTEMIFKLLTCFYFLIKS